MGDYEERQGALVHRTANLVGNVRIGRGSRIDAFVTITGDVSLGRCVHISTGACIFGAAGVEIGDYSGLSPGVKLFTATEDLSGDWYLHPTSPANLRRVVSSPFRMGAHCTVGANSVLLPGAELGEGACVGALSLVKRPLPGWAIYAGVPVKFIRRRSNRVLTRKPSDDSARPD